MNKNSTQRPMGVALLGSGLVGGSVTQKGLRFQKLKSGPV